MLLSTSKSQKKVAWNGLRLVACVRKPCRKVPGVKGLAEYALSQSQKFEVYA